LGNSSVAERLAASQEESVLLNGSHAVASGEIDMVKLMVAFYSFLL
jgi:hypothetical protein